MWRMGRRKVINNLWMKSNKRLGEGRWGRSLFVGLHVSVILRWLRRVNVLQNAAEIMQKKNRNKTNARAHKHGKQRQNAATEKHVNPSNASQR